MTSKQFVLATITLATAMCLAVIAFNVAMDEFGLYRSHEKGSLRVWTYNRASKYLLAQQHVPRNYDALLIGSSSSAYMLDPAGLDSIKLYNLSMNGANICEVAPAALAALEHGTIRYLIVCLDPYLTKNSMMKTNELSPKLQSSILGSLFTVKFYGYKLYFSLFPEKDPYRNSWDGYRLYLPENRILAPEEIDNAVTSAPFNIDPSATECLRSVLEAAREGGTRIIAYYHLKPYKLYQAQKTKYEQYKKEMTSLLKPEDTIIDFDAKQYEMFARNLEMFHDTAHLTRKGGDAVMAVLNSAIKRFESDGEKQLHQ